VEKVKLINQITRIINSLYKYEESKDDFYQKTRDLIKLLEWYRDILMR